MPSAPPPPPSLPWTIALPVVLLVLERLGLRRLLLGLQGLLLLPQGLQRAELLRGECWLLCLSWRAWHARGPVVALPSRRPPWQVGGASVLVVGDTVMPGIGAISALRLPLIAVACMVVARLDARESRHRACSGRRSLGGLWDADHPR